MGGVITVVSFTVIGHPEPGGSKRAVPMKGTAGGARVVDANRKVMPWRALVSGAAQEAMHGAEPMRGALGLVVTFYVQRPQGHYGTGRNAGTVKDHAPRAPIVRPDVTKLIRAVEDACTSIVWRDDAQVTVQIARKRYGTPERCEVEVRTL
jgi:Holliday junction resolvase RusA-like endonuclease